MGKGKQALLGDRWWRARSTGAQLVLLAVLMPGVLLHECTHALVASPWADATFDWDGIAVDLHWRPGTPETARVLAHLAPLVIGWWIGLGAGVWLVAVEELTLPIGLVLYFTIQWVLYTLFSWGDFEW